MALFIRETFHFVLNGRTITGTDALDFSTEQCRPVKILPDDTVRLFICIRKPAGNLLPLQMLIHKGEGNDLLISVLTNHFVIMKGRGKSTGRRACLEPPEFHSVLPQIFRQFFRRGKSVRTAGEAAVADEYFSTQECSRGEDHRLAPVNAVSSGHNAADSAFFCQQIHNLILFHVQILLPLQSLFHLQMILIFIRLRTQRMNGRSLRCIQHSALDESLIDIDTHFSAERIDLSDQMSFAGSSDRRITRHHGNSLKID